MGCAGRSRSHVMFFKRVSRLAEQLLTEQLLAERLLAERLLDTEQLLAEQLLGERLLAEQLLLRLMKKSSHLHITERVHCTKVKRKLLRIIEILRLSDLIYPKGKQSQDVVAHN